MPKKKEIRVLIVIWSVKKCVFDNHLRSVNSAVVSHNERERERERKRERKSKRERERQRERERERAHQRERE